MAEGLKSLIQKRVPLTLRIALAARLGRTNWYRLGDGITFREAGFVAAQSPANLLVRHNYETRAISHLLKGVKVDAALEIGCGYGRLSPIIAQFADHLISVDHNPDVLSAAERYYPEVDYRVASVTALPFVDGAFDLVVSWTVLQHVPPQHIEKAASEIIRVLKPDGILLLCEETKHADLKSHAQTHTWHRTVDEYRRLFDSLNLEHDSWIDELERLQGIGSPGRVMFFRSR